jgi:hypothetical protein
MKAKGDNPFFPEKHYWDWTNGEIKNKLTSYKPFVMHFPGRNWKYYNIVAKSLNLAPDFEYVDGSRINTLKEYLKDKNVRTICGRIVFAVAAVLISITLSSASMIIVCKQITCHTQKKIK